MTTVTADKVVVELSVLLDKYQADVKSARSNFEQAMSATQISAANAERSIETAANKIAASTVGIGSEAKRTAAIVEQSNTAMGESATATAAVIARATELQTVEFAKQAAASAKAAAAIQESSAAIKSGLLAGAAPIAALFAVSEVVKLTDEYIKFQNALRATGLEGAALTGVQERLFAVAQKYGTPLESLGALYSRAAIAGKELGLSQDQLIKLSEGVAASFKVAGTGAAQQKGALTQLSEAIGEPIVKARQFNSLLNDAPPIIQAVARGLDAAGGSVAKLGTLIRSGSVTNTEFFTAFLKGSQSTINQADKFQLTFGAAFTVLQNALSKYIGETNDSIDVSSRFALGIQAVAQNLDTIIPALGVVAAAYGAMKIASAVAGSAAVKAARDVAVATTEQTAAIVDGRTAAAIAARAEADAVRAIVAEIELEVAARRELAATLVLNGAAEAEVLAADRAVIAVQRDLIVAEGEAAAAIAAETAAVTEAGIAARLAAAGSALFSGALALLGGPVIAPIVIVVGALTAAILALRAGQSAAEKQTREFAATIDSNDRYLKSLKASADGAAEGVKNVGSSAATATAPIGAFAGAVGTAADNLHRLAAARRADALAATDAQIAATRTQITGLGQRLADSAPSNTTLSKVGIVPSAARDADQAKLATLQAQLTALQSARTTQAAVPLESRLTAADRAGGRNLPVELQALEAEHTAAVKAGNKTAAEQIEEQINVRKLTTKYMKDGLSAEAATAAATADAAKIRSGEQTGDAARLSRSRAARGDPATTGLEAQRAAAVAAKNGDLVRELDEQIFIRKQTTKYLREGLSSEDAVARATREAGAIRTGGDATAQAARAARLASIKPVTNTLDDALSPVNDELDKIDKQSQNRSLKTFFAPDLPKENAAVVEGLKSIGDAAKAAQSDAEQFKSDLSSGLVDAALHARSLGDVLVNSIERAGEKLLDSKLLDLLDGKGLGGISGGGLGSIFSSLFGGGGGDPITGGIGSLISANSGIVLPGRASGGDVVAGQSYIVGEGGMPEVFTPATSGTITPNRSLAASGGGGGTTVVQPHNYDLRGAVVTADLLAQMDAKANDAAVRGAAGGAALARSQSARAARYRLA